MSKRILKIISIIAGAIAVLLLLIILFFSTSPGENYLKDLIVDAVSSRLGLSVEIESLETNLISRIRLDNTVVISPSSSTGDSLLYVEKLIVTYSLFDLLLGDIDLGSVTVDNVNLYISVDSLGQYGIPLLDTAQKPTPGHEASSTSIAVKRVVLSGINAVYSDKRIPIDISLYNLSSRINGHGKTDYDGTLAADSITARYEDQPFLTSNLNCEFSWDGRELSLKSNAEIEGLGLTASGSVQLPAVDSLSLNATLEGDPSDIIKILGERYSLPSTEMKYILIDAHAEGSIGSPEVDLRIISPGGRVRNIDMDSLLVYARYSSEMVNIDSAIVNLLGGAVTAAGSVTMKETRTVAIDLRIGNLKLSELWPVIYGNKSPFTGNIKGAVRAGGRIDAVSGWDINGKLDISSLRYNNRPAADLGLDFLMTNDKAQLKLVHAGDTVRTEAVLRNGNIEGRFYADIPKISSISRFADLPELKGSILAEGTFEGSMDNPDVNVRLKGDKISYRNFPVDSLVADLQYRDSSLVINNLQLSGIRSDSAMYQDILGVDSLKGTFEYNCEIRGTSDYLRGTISAELASLEYAGYSLDSASTIATIDGSKINIDSLKVYIKNIVFNSSGSYDTVTARGNLKTKIFSFSAGEDYPENEDSKSDLETVERGSVETDFDLSSEGKFKFEIEGDSIWLGLLSSFAAIEAPDEGFLDLSLSFEGNSNKPKGALSATAYSISTTTYKIDSVTVAAELDDDYLRMDKFRLFAYDNSISASGDLYLDRDRDNRLVVGNESAVSGRMAMENLDLSILQPYIVPDGTLTGKASANVTWDGTVKSPGLAGWIDVSNGNLIFNEGSTSIDQIYLGLHLSDSLLTIDSVSCYSAGTPLSAEGTVRYRIPDSYELSADISVDDIVLLSANGSILRDSLDFRISSDNFDLAILTPFIAPADSLGGSLNSEVFIRGKMAAPQITGFVKVSGFSLFSREYSAALKSGFLDARFESSRIDLDSLYVDINGGPLVMSGYLVHDGETLTDINLGLKASNISYEKKDIFKGELQSADLKYSRKEDQYFLDGDISLGESRLTAKFPLKSVLPWAQSVETVEHVLPDIIARTRLNVRFRENHDLWIDNNLANIRMKAELNMIGTPVKPNLSGPVNIEEGYLIYLDRRFEVEEGKLYFADPMKLNPDITLQAKTQVTIYQRTVAEKYTIHIKVEGNLENLRADLYSEPPLDKPDIVALLTLGTTRSRLTGSENQGGVKSVLVERASRLTSNRISGYISNKVGSMFGFDEFTVTGNLFRFDNSWGPRLVASRHISKRVELTYSTTVGHLNDQGVRLGYKLTTNISIQGETDQAGRSGIDLRYGVKFK